MPKFVIEVNLTDTLNQPALVAREVVSLLHTLKDLDMLVSHAIDLREYTNLKDVLCEAADSDTNLVGARMLICKDEFDTALTEGGSELTEETLENLRKRLNQDEVIQ